MKKNLLFLVVSALLWGGTATAQTEFSGECGAEGDNVTWKFNTETGVLEISGTGMMKNYGYYDYLPWLDYYSSIRSVTIDNGVTTIGEYAFQGCENLTTITIPNSVTTIGEWAFSGTGLTEVTIPENVTSIGDHAFSDCRKLNEAWFNADSCMGGLTDCATLTTLHIGENVRWIPYYAFANTGLTSLTIPENVAIIGNYAFSHCWNLTDITISEGVTTIGNEAFSGCTGLTSVTIPESVTSIGNEAFHGCTELTGATIGSGVTVIGDGAFGYCSSLKSFTGNFASSDNRCLIIDNNLVAFASAGLSEYAIPNGVKRIVNEAFSCCNDLKSVTIPESITIIDEGAFQGCESLTDLWFNADSCISGGFSGCYTLATVHIGENVKRIPDKLFSNCRNLKKFTGKFASTDTRCLVVNDTLVVLAPYGLTEYTIPENVKVIGNDVFQECADLMKVTISENVTALGNDAFSYCRNLNEAWFNADSCISGDFGWCYVTTVHIGENVKCIPDKIFSDCIALKEFTGKFASTDKRCLVVNDTLIALAPSELTEYVIPNGVIAIDDYAFKNCTDLKSVTIPESVTIIEKRSFIFANSLTEVWFNADSCISGGFEWCPLETVHIGENVKRIPDEAFSECSRLTEITIPNGCCVIGNNAFSGCRGLLSVTIPESITTIGNSAFSDCNGLTEITIPNNVTLINEGTFSWCSGLSEIVIPNGVTSIGNNAFSGTGLTEVTIPENVTNIGDDAFNGCWNLKEVWFNADSCISGGFGWCPLETVHIGENVKRIPNNAFSSCSELQSVTIPNSVITIGDEAFSNCRNLTTVTIGSGVTNIDDYAFSYCRNLNEAWFNADSCLSGGFSGCEALKTVHFGENVKRIPDNAFSWCRSLSEIAIPNGATSIGNNAFSGTGLTEVTIPENVTTIGNSAFSGCENLTEVWFNADSCISGGFSGCYTLATVHIGENVKRIPDNAFSWCSGLSEIVIPNGATSIGNNAFSGTGLTEVTIPESVTSIGEMAFQDCNNLMSVTIGNSVTTIGYGVFEDCSSLTSVTIPESVTSIGNYAFNGCTGLKKFEGKFASADNRCLIVNDTLIAFAPSELIQYTIPEGVIAIEDELFFNCDSLKSITIPESVTAIGYMAFSYCDSLTTVTAYNPIPVDITDAFEGVDYDNCTLYVPESSIEAYKAAEGWMTFKEILPINETDEPENPDVPDVPSEPENPDTPDTPDTPDVPDVPENPDEPDTPDVPDVPDVPDEPENPDTPDEPIVPDEPDEPASVTETPTDAEHITVYTLQGVPVLETNDAADLRKLSAGAYIVNGKKIIITR